MPGAAAVIKRHAASSMKKTQRTPKSKRYVSASDAQKRVNGAGNGAINYPGPAR